MNFHKTIGFLAALLLMVGLGAPDSFAQGTFTLSVTPGTVRERSQDDPDNPGTLIALGTPVTIKATLSAAPGTGQSVTIPLLLSPTTPAYTTDPGTVPDIVISGTDTEEEIQVTIIPTHDDVYNHPREDKVTVTAGVVTFSGTGDYTRKANDEASFVIREDDEAIGPLNLSINPPSVDAAGSADQDVTVTVALNEAPGTEDADDDPDTPETDVVVTVTVTATGVDGTTPLTVGGAVTITGSAKNGTTTVTVPAGSAIGNVNVVANAVDYTNGEISIPVIGRDASDVTGYRVLLTAPGNNVWAGKGKKKVTVEVVRADEEAYPWTEFSSIAVSLRDTLLADTAIYTLTASGFNTATGDLTFGRARVENGVTPDPAFGKNADANEITYNEGADKLIFKFEIKTVTVANAVARLGDIPDTGPGSDRNGEDAAGQRTAVYAHVIFNVGETALTLNNRSQKKITGASDIAVGDGKLIKLDFLLPSATIRNGIFPADPVVTINGETATKGKKGDVIRVAVARSDVRPRSSDASKAQIVIQSILNTDVIGSAKSIPLKTWTFSIQDLIRASGDSLRVSIKVEDLAAQNTVYSNKNTRKTNRDGVELKNSDKVKYEPDNLQMNARVRISDQAGNNSGTRNSSEFRADPRAPGISVLHPTSDSKYFSGHNRNTIDNEVGINYDKHLKPLELRADEALDSLFVYIKGAESERLNLMDADAERGHVTKAFTRPNYFQEEFGDTTSYDTRGLKWKDAKGKVKATGQGGRTVDLVIDAYDLVGNKTSMTLEGVHHDEVIPKITDWFPKNSLLDDNKINNSTRHPTITLKEAVDSLAVRYDPSGGDDIVVEETDVAKGEHGVAITEDFEAGKTYTLTIFARDLAGNVFVTAEDSARAMEFDASFPNPIANMFKVSAQHDSMIAGRPNPLTIQVVDKESDSDKSRNVVTYRNDGAVDVILVAMDEMGETASSVRFSGKGVTDNEDGTGSLDAANWVLGKRKVDVTSDDVIDNFTVAVKHRVAGDAGTAVVSFSGEQDSLYVDAADFRKITLTAIEDGEEGVGWVWEDFELRMVPTDAHGNPSLKTYLNDEGAKDSLSVLDTRVTKDMRYADGIDIRLQATPAVGGLLSEVWGVGEEGYTLAVTAPDRRGSSLIIQARVLHASLKGDDDATRDTRSENLRGDLRLTITPNLMPVLSVWLDDGDVTGQEVEVPIGGSVTVTVAAGGFMAGSSVTFTKNGAAMSPVTANDEGVAKLDITMSAPGTVEVSAASGEDAADAISIEFVKQSRKEYVDSEGNAVFLVYTGDSPPDLTVGDNDFQAFAAAYPSSEGDDNYNVQADIDGDGDVDLEDFNMFAVSWGRTAVGPSSKPLVLLPGINENAEFSLRLGSERVVPGELIALDVALANVQALTGYGFVLHYDASRFEFISAAPATEDLLKSSGGETPLFQHWVTDGQVKIANSVINGTAVSGGGDIARLTFRVLQEFEENVRFEVADGLVFDPQQLSNLAVVAGVLELQSTPMEFALHQNFPNPFNPDTTIKYELAESADVTLQIYNVLGQVVRTLVASESQPPGRYQIRWNGMDDRGVSVSSGVYFYKISAEGKFHNVRKLMLLK